jgi:O-acetylhomoserine/O-acetylserine sulfhydrylase-like pyridoxal-dependent enzyme
MSAAEQRWCDRQLRGARWAGRGLDGGGCDACRVDYRQSRRYQDHFDPSGVHHPWPNLSEAREASGIRESLLRIAVGLESVEDLKADLARGLALIA